MRRFRFVVVALALGIPASTPAVQQTAAPDAGKRIPHLDVKSVKTVASTCV
jgi:hypothetical protein